MIFIIKGFRSIVFIFIVISTKNVEISINMKGIVWKPLMIKIIKLRLKFRQQTPEEDRRTCRPKHCGNNNKDEDNSSKTLNDKKI